VIGLLLYRRFLLVLVGYNSPRILHYKLFTAAILENKLECLPLSVTSALVGQDLEPNIRE
jgi:hypothetical protein